MIKKIRNVRMRIKESGWDYFQKKKYSKVNGTDKNGDHNKLKGAK